MCFRGQKLNLAQYLRIAFNSKTVNAINPFPPPTLPGAHTSSHPKFHDSDTADLHSREEKNTVLKKIPETVTCQFFGLFQETLYQNAVIVDKLGYKC